MRIHSVLAENAALGDSTFSPKCKLKQSVLSGWGSSEANKTEQRNSSDDDLRALM